MAYYDDNGNIIEGLLTKEEAEKKVADVTSEMTQKFEAEKKAAEEKAEVAAKEVEEARAALEAGEKAGDSGDKEKNLGILRRKLEETEKALKAATEENKQRWGAFESERVSQSIAVVAGTDEKLAEKIKFHFDTTLAAVKAGTPEQIQQKVMSAYKLAQDIKPVVPNPLDAARGGSSRGQDGASRPLPKNFSQDDVSFAKKLGISEEDIKKYGGKTTL